MGQFSPLERWRAEQEYTFIKHLASKGKISTLSTIENTQFLQMGHFSQKYDLDGDGGGMTCKTAETVRESSGRQARARRADDAVPMDIPVSYTHLTLPTTPYV